MTAERIQYDGPELDEIVVENVTLHIEKMDAHHWMIRAYRPELKGPIVESAVDIHLSGANLFEVETITGLPVINRPAIEWCHVWTRAGVEHQCYSRPHNPPTRHKCSCGATTQNGGLHS